MNSGATKHFGVPLDAFMGTFEVLVGDEEPQNVIVTNKEEGVSLPENLHLITSRRKLEAIDETLAAKDKFMSRSDVLLEPIQALRGKYDYIFLDTAVVWTNSAHTPTLVRRDACCPPTRTLVSMRDSASLIVSVTECWKASRMRVSPPRRQAMLTDFGT